MRQGSWWRPSLALACPWEGACPVAASATRAGGCAIACGRAAVRLTLWVNCPQGYGKQALLVLGSTRVRALAVFLALCSSAHCICERTQTYAAYCGCRVQGPGSTCRVQGQRAWLLAYRRVDEAAMCVWFYSFGPLPEPHEVCFVPVLSSRRLNQTPLSRLDWTANPCRPRTMPADPAPSGYDTGRSGGDQAGDPLLLQCCPSGRCPAATLTTSPHARHTRIPAAPCRMAPPHQQNVCTGATGASDHATSIRSA